MVHFSIHSWIWTVAADGSGGGGGGGDVLEPLGAVCEPVSSGTTSGVSGTSGVTLLLLGFPVEISRLNYTGL